MKFIQIEDGVDEHVEHFAVKVNNIVTVILYRNPFPDDKEKDCCVYFEVMAGSNAVKVQATKFDTFEETDKKYKDYLELLSKM